MEIPIFKFDIDETKQEAGIYAISLVLNPAIESNFQFFDEHKPKLKFTKVDGYEGRVHGLALIPDKKILRTDAKGENPFYGVFSADVIKKLAAKFMKDSANNEVNVNHNDSAFIDAYMVENFIIDSTQRLEDVKQRGITDAVLGSWYVQYQIDNPQVFQQVVDGQLKGFSIEANLDLMFKAITQDNNNDNKIENLMNKLFKVTEQFQAIVDAYKAKTAPHAVLKFTVSAIAESADSVEYSKVGEPVSVVLPDGSKQPALQGDIPLGDGQVLVVDAAGNMVSIGIEAAKVDAPSGATSGSTEQKQEAAVVAPAVNTAHFEAEIEALKAEIVALKSDKAGLNQKLEAVNTELIKFKKAPQANPVLQTATTKVEKNFKNMTNLELVAAKAGIQLSANVLKSKLNK